MILVWLRMAASADPASGPIWLRSRLQARVQEECMLMALTEQRTLGLVTCLSEVIELLLIPSHSLVMPSAV